MGVPIKIVVNRMVDPAAILAAITQVQRSYSEMLEERRVIGAGAERADPEVMALTRFLPLFGRNAFHMTAHALRVPNARQLLPLPHRNIFLRVLNVARHTIDKFLQRM